MTKAHTKFTRLPLPIGLNALKIATPDAPAQVLNLMAVQTVSASAAYAQHALREARQLDEAYRANVSKWVEHIRLG